jgi:hypothetical protein
VLRYHVIGMDGQSNATKNLIQNDQCPGRDLNLPNTSHYYYYLNEIACFVSDGEEIYVDYKILQGQNGC